MVKVASLRLLHPIHTDRATSNSLDFQVNASTTSARPLIQVSARLGQVVLAVFVMRAVHAFLSVMQGQSALLSLLFAEST